MSRMEEDASRFLKRIVWSLSIGMLWLFINIGMGIYNGWLIPKSKIGIVNILFYIWVLLSLAALIWIYYKIWKEKFPHG